MKYLPIISKIQEIKATKSYSEFSPSELELITDALETIQFLEIILAQRAKKENLENYESH
jgi:hypothetical protein